MLFSTQTALSLGALLFTTTTSAAPTRTHCRCTIVSNAVPPPPIYSPSVAHWTPTDPSPSPAAQDFCANLGPELENFPHAAQAFINAHSNADDQQQTTSSSPSTSTNIYVNFASSRNRDTSNEPRPTERPHQRIVCREEPEPFTAYQDSCVTLWTLHVIVAVAILACLAEGVQLGIQRYQASLGAQSGDEQDGYFRLPGSEKLLLAIPATQVEESMFSPGVEKKLRAGSMSAVHAPCGKREFVAYEDEDDDEANRPVM